MKSRTATRSVRTADRKEYPAVRSVWVADRNAYPAVRSVRATAGTNTRLFGACG